MCSRCERSAEGPLVFLLFLEPVSVYTKTSGFSYVNRDLVPDTCMPSHRRSFGAADVALNVFSSLSTGVNVCVLSDGVLLERQ